MKNTLKSFLTVFFPLALAVIFAFNPGGKTSAQEIQAGQTGKIAVYLFHSLSCPHCQAEIRFLDRLTQKYSYIEVKAYELSESGSREVYLDYSRRLGFAATYTVPMTVIGDKYIAGFLNDETTGKEIEDYIVSLKNGQAVFDGSSRSTFAIFGKTYDFKQNESLALMAVVFGLADGINPCMFSVLLMLLAYLLSAGSAKRAVWSGIFFGACVFIIYLALMAGIYKSLAFFGGALSGAVPVLKLVFGIVFVFVGAWMAKDYFFLKEGQKVSFSIPQSAHPLIKKLVRQSSWAAVALLALFSSLVELPCTFALPLGYAAILAERDAFPYFYLVLYNLFFVLPLFAIVAAVGFGFSKTKSLESWRDHTKKTMRLVSGLLLLFLGAAFLLKIF